MRSLLSVFTLCGVLLSNAALGGSESGVDADALCLENSGPKFASRGQAVVTQRDFDAAMQEIPAHHRAMFLESPQRIAEMLEGLLMVRQVSHAAIEAGFLSDPIILSKVRDIALRRLSRLYLEEVWEERRLEDYTGRARELYLAEPDRFRLPPRYDFSHFLVPVTAEVGELAAMERVVAFFEALQSDEPFDQVATSFSSTNDGESVEVRFRDVTLDALDRDVASAMRSMGEGQIAGPIRSRHGWHVVKLHERSVSEVRDFEDVKEQALALAEQQHRSSIRDRFTRQFSDLPVEYAEDAVRSLRERYPLTDEHAAQVQQEMFID